MTVMTLTILEWRRTIVMNSAQAATAREEEEEVPVRSECKNLEAAAAVAVSLLLSPPLS